MSWESSSQRPVDRADAAGLSGATFTLLRDLIADRTGVHFDESKRGLLADKLAVLVDSNGLSSFLDYYYLLKYDGNTDANWRELLNRLSVPETFFWRQAEHFTALATVIAPAHFAARPGVPLRIWSAACCTGEEPLSIAIALREAGLLGHHPVEILASDASAAMIERARAGRYGDRSFRALPLPLREKYFQQAENGWQIDPAIHGAVKWLTANLMESSEISMLAASHVIFCRNVFIYFTDAAISKVVREFGTRMPAPGYLFLGASESLLRITTDFTLEQIDRAFVYMKGSQQVSTADMPAAAARQNTATAGGR